MGQHLLGWEGILLVAFGNAQALLIFFEADFDTPGAQIIKVDRLMLRTSASNQERDEGG